MYECSGAAVTNYHKLGNLQQQRLTLLWLWRPGTQNQSVSRAMLPLKLQGRILPASSSFWWVQVFLARGHITQVSASVFM